MSDTAKASSPIGRKNIGPVPEARIRDQPMQRMAFSTVGPANPAPDFPDPEINLRVSAPVTVEVSPGVNFRTPPTPCDRTAHNPRGSAGQSARAWATPRAK